MPQDRKIAHCPFHSLMPAERETFLARKRLLEYMGIQLRQAVFAKESQWDLKRLYLSKRGGWQGAQPGGLARSWEAHTRFLETPSQPGVFVLPSYLHWDFRLGCLGHVPEDPDSWAQKGHKRDLSCHCPGRLLGWVPLALVSLPLSRSSLGREVGGAGPGPRRGLRLHHGSASVNSMFVQCQRRPGSGSAPPTCPAVMGWGAHDT